MISQEQIVAEATGVPTLEETNLPVAVTAAADIVEAETAVTEEATAATAGSQNRTTVVAAEMATTKRAADLKEVIPETEMIGEKFSKTANALKIN